MARITHPAYRVVPGAPIAALMLGCLPCAKQVSHIISLRNGVFYTECNLCGHTSPVPQALGDFWIELANIVEECPF